MPGRYGLNVGIVANDHRLVQALAASFRKLGHEVRESSNVAEYAASMIVPPDVLIFEINSNDPCQADQIRGMFEHEVKRKPLFIALADRSDLYADRRAKDAGIQLVLVKPIEPALLAGVLRRFQDMLTTVEVLAPLT